MPDKHRYFLKISHGYEKRIKKSLCAKFLFYMKKICTQEFKRYLDWFSCDFFNRTHKINISQTFCFWVNL